MADPVDVVREISEILDTHYAVPADLPRWHRYRDELDKTGLGGSGWTAAALDRGLRELGLSHTARFTRDQIEFYHLLDAYSGLRFFHQAVKEFWRGGVTYTGIGITTQEDRCGRRFVTGVLPGSPAARAGLAVGDELVAVQGQPFQPVLSFEGLAGRSVQLQLRRERDGPTLELRLVPAQCRPGRMLAQATRRSTKVIVCDGQQVGYIKAWSLAGQAQWRSLTNAILRDLGGCATLVLDLRGGVGGASPDYADFFLGRSPEVRLKTPRSDGETVVNACWRKPVVVIADDTTKSGNEVLAFAMKNAGVPLVGGRTAGEVVAGKPFLLSDRSLLLVAAKLVTVDGIVLEGIGVEPTVRVAREIPYSGGDDKPLREACRIASTLAEVNGPTGPGSL